MSRYLNPMDMARVAAIIACVGLLYSPSVATIGLIAAYVLFLAGRQEAVVRFKAVIARPLGYWGLAFLGVVFIGMIYASVSWHDRWMDFYRWRTILWMLVLLALFDDGRWKERFLIAFLAATGVAVVASNFSAVSGIPIWRGAHEVLRNSGTQGMAFACAALVCAWLVLAKKQIGVHPRLLSVLGLLYVSNVVFVTNSRSGYVVLGGGLAILLLWNASLKEGVLIVMGLLVAGGLAFAASSKMQQIVTAGVTQWANESESEHLTNFGSRRVFYQNSMELLQEHWVFGVGTGGFVQAYGDHVSKKYDALDWRGVRTTDPHNQYLSIAIQQGVAGVVLFVVWLAAIAREREAPRDCHQLAIAILLSWCVTSLFSSHFRTFAEGHLFATFLGVLLAVEARTKDASPVPPRSAHA